MKSKFILFASALLLSASAFAQSFVSTGGQKFVLLEKNTGAWCGYCPDGVTVLDQILTSTPNAIGVAVHDHTQFGWPLNGDSFEIPAGDSFCNTIYSMKAGPYSHADSNIGGSGNPYPYTGNSYPAACIDRTLLNQNRGAWQSGVNTQLSVAPSVDVTLMHSFNSATNTVTFTIAAKTLAALTGQYNMNVYVVEDSVQSVAPQSTGTMQHSYLYATPSGDFWNNKGTPDPSNPTQIWDLTTANCGFYHMHVLRAMLGGTWGTSGVIPNNAPSGNTYVKTYTYVIPSGQTASHLKFVGLVQQYTANDVTQRKIANAVQAKFSPTASISNVNATISDVSIHPNPAGDFVVVKGNLAVSSDAKITLTNTMGQTIYSQTVPAAGTSLNTTINLSNVANGVYFVNVTSEGYTASQKLVVSK